MAQTRDQPRSGMIVVDVTVIAYLLIAGRKTELALHVRARDREWRCPPLWRAEFLNVLALQVRHGDVQIDWRNSIGDWRCVLSSMPKLPST